LWPILHTLPIRVADVKNLSSLPEIHKDPFDRILIAQSISEAIAVVTRDSGLGDYGLSTIW
jgi:PIN domain nuclease of toxin-antitoxin system